MKIQQSNKKQSFDGRINENQMNTKNENSSMGAQDNKLKEYRRHCSTTK